MTMIINEVNLNNEIKVIDTETKASITFSRDTPDRINLDPRITFLVENSYGEDVDFFFTVSQFRSFIARCNKLIDEQNNPE